MKRKFYIYLSIFLSLCCTMSLQAKSSHRTAFAKTASIQVLATSFKPLESYNRFDRQDYIRPSKASRSAYKPLNQPAAVTTTIPKPAPVRPVVSSTTSTSVPSAPAKAPASAICQAHEMSLQEAHSCWDSLLQQYAWPQAKAFHIMFCESTGNYMARNKHSTATGLFQILGGPVDPRANVALAFQMFQQRGWQPWLASSGCWG